MDIPKAVGLSLVFLNVTFIIMVILDNEQSGIK